MPAKIYRVTLTDEERQTLTTMVKTGKGAAYRLTRARILLLADEQREDGGFTDEKIATALSIGQRTVERIREKCIRDGIEAALTRKPRIRSKEKIFDGVSEAKVVQLACSEPPDGYATWSLRLLTEQIVELEIVPTVGRETVRATLKKMNLSLG